MWEKNLGQRMLLIGIVLLVSVLFLFTYSYETGEFDTRLRAGLDIAGGVSMIFEINDEGVENWTNLAEEMKQLLQRRVDPAGVYGLEWRVHGRNRIEVQMPLPPPGIKLLRQDYDEARKQLVDRNVTRGELEAALELTGEERAARMHELADGQASREEALLSAAKASDTYRAALAALNEARAATTGDVAPENIRELELALRDSEEDLEDSIEAVRATNFPFSLLEEVLARDASKTRDAQLNELIEGHPNLKADIENVVAKHAAWSEKRTFLDGPADLQRLLRGAGVLTFRILAEPAPENLTRYDALREDLAKRGPKLARTSTEAWFEIDDPVNFFNLDSPNDLQGKDPKDFERSGTMIVAKRGETWYVLARTDPSAEMKGDSKRSWQLRGVRQDRDELGRPSVNFFFDVRGGNLFGQLTGANVEKQLCIFIDDVAYSAARIAEKIHSSGRITGDFSQAKVLYLVQTMQAGALPARLKDTPISERTLGSSLGAANLHRALRAGVVGVIAVMLVMLVYYMWAGAIANVALCFNILLVLAAMSMLNARITLAGIAGIILTIGMSVDANVLIFERMREEKARGSSLRMMIKNGYDKAFSTIIDANITTLLICVILYYVGSEEVKGFGLTLGWGIVISLFTALFVTRTIFSTLLKYHVIKDVAMLHLIGVPKVDWYAKRKLFLPLSLAVLVVGLGLLFNRGTDALDVEFRGGVSAELELLQSHMTVYDNQENAREIEVNDITLRDDLIAKVADDISRDGARLVEATVADVPGDPRSFVVALPGVSSARLAALLAEPMEDHDPKLIARAGIDIRAGRDEVLIRVEDGVSKETLVDFIHSHAREAEAAGERIRRAQIAAVLETESESKAGLIWTITTTETNKRLVQHVLESALGDNLNRQPAVSFQVRGDGRPYPITERRLGEVIPEIPEAVAGRDVGDFLDGAAIYLDELNPPQSTEHIAERLRNMRLQPDFQDLPWRDATVIGVSPTGENDLEGNATYSGVVVLVVDPEVSYTESPESWAVMLADPELRLAQDTLSTEQALRKVSQFKPQIASQSQLKALMALMLSWLMIIGYMWLRFGRVAYGLAGVVALIHDVLIALAAVGISGWIGGTNHPIGEFFLIEDFHINMTIVAAFLTIIGYSINDTIVIFDRIRETRGRLGVVTPAVINNSINQCLARTIMTSLTTLVVLLTMYIFGGTSIRGFNFCMIIGIITGTYSSVAVAAPLLMLALRREAVRAGASMETTPA